ncbi:MAG: hypothetical protein ACRDPD_26065 [Streptosporangiaceae bacterium]
MPGNLLVTPSHIVPEIYLLPFYAILRAIPNKTLGVIALLASILVLFLLPLSHNHIIDSSKFRPIYKYGVYFIIIIFILLTYIGQTLVVQPYIFIGQILTSLYFLFFFFFLPLCSFLEFFLFLL